jgi:hypothetical protein
MAIGVTFPGNGRLVFCFEVFLTELSSLNPEPYLAH